MGKNFSEKVASGIDTLQGLVESQGEIKGLASRIAVEKRLRQIDILVTAYGDNNLEKEIIEYKFNGNLDNYAEDVKYTKDIIYGEIKDFEYLKDYISKLGQYTNHRDIITGLDDLLELYSELFNKWETYSELFGEDEDTLTGNEAVEEYDYSDLVGEEEEPMTRTGRRKKR